MSKILGIDLGTTNSAFAVVNSSGEAEILENAEGGRTTPSIVAISKSNERLVGVSAKRQAVTNPENTVFGVKRFIGHRFADKEVQNDMKISPFTIKESSNGGVKFVLQGKEYTPEEISAMILRKIKNDAEKRIGETITDVVITVPAYFDDNQRKATQDAGKIAGLNVKRIINEPTAAALAYGLNKKENEKIVVFDLGGGTFDVSILEVGDKVVEVKSTEGNSHMGGRDIDQKIIKWICAEFKRDSGIDLSTDKLALQRLDETAEKAKIELSEASETEINIPFITSDASGPKHLLLKFSRAQLNKLADEYITRSIEITKKAIEASTFDISEIDEIVLVGGQTRMPAIQEAVKKLFKKEPNRSINPDEVVAIGAAIQGGILKGDIKDVLLLDVIPLSLGIETMGGVATKVIERNTTIPASQSQIFSTASDNQPSVDLNIVQGERSMVADNKSIGRFVLDGIAPAARGTPQIKVIFDMNANGILSVKAKDEGSGKEQSIRIEGSSGLSKEEVEKMKNDADINAVADKKKKEEIEERNTAEQLIYSTENSLKEYGDKIDLEKKKEIEDAITDIKPLLKKTVSEFKPKIEQLAKISQEAFAKVSQENSDKKDKVPEDVAKDVEVEDADESDSK